MKHELAHCEYTELQYNGSDIHGYVVALIDAMDVAAYHDNQSLMICWNTNTFGGFIGTSIKMIGTTIIYVIQ